MAKNDAIILDSIIDERVSLKIPSGKRDEAFEYFVIEELLKDYNLKKEEISDGLVDGQNDGGIDAFFIMINGHYLTDIENFYWPRTSIDLEVYLITCKHHETYKQAPLDNLVATLSELLDLSIDESLLNGDYNREVLRKRQLLHLTYRRIASKIAHFSFNVIYASRGDSNSVGDPIRSRAQQITDIISDSFNNSNVNFKFWGSAELIESFRKKPNFSLELKFVEYLGRGERYVLLCKLTDYYQFIIDEDKKLRRYLFDSNVRDFMGLNSVNDDIKITLNNISSPDFWWLNNGVTILATSGRVIGESIQIEDIQIVNGLQTTESIFNHFNSGANDPNERSVLVKVLVSKDAEIRDSIIRATNNQTTVQTPALHATDKIQRDIEDILLTENLYYERRTNFYVNRNIPNSLIVAPLYLATAFTTLVRKDPYGGSMLKSRFMRKPESYKKVFSSDFNILLYPTVAKIYKRCDEILELNRRNGPTGSEGFLKKWRHLLAFVTVVQKLTTFDYKIEDLISFSIDDVSEAELNATWNYISSFDFQSSGNSRLTNSTVDQILLQVANDQKVSGVQKMKIETKPGKFLKLPSYLSAEFVDKVNELLPPQPWKADDILDVQQKLKCGPNIIRQVIKYLVGQGLRLKQREGVLFDKDNKIVGIDNERIASDFQIFFNP